MPECSYCGDTVPDEEAYLAHLDEEHRDELGRIDRRRVEAREQETTRRVSPLAIAVFAILLVGAGAALLFVGGEEDGEPTYDPSVHVHGTMTVTIDGTEVPLSESAEFVENDEIFHFHGYEMDRYGEHVWHIHGTDVTLQWALATLGIEVDEEGTTVRYDGETFDDDDPNTTVTILVNGDPVDPGTYELDGVGPEDQAAAGAGDDVEITVTRDG